MGFRTPNFQQFQQPQQQKQFQEQDQGLQPVGKRQRGTGFTNIGKILGANIGAGERMGRQVGQAVGMQAGQARAGVTQAQEKFETAKKEAEQKADLAQQGIKSVLDDTSGLAGLTEEQAKERRERFLKEGQYAGPKGLEQEAQLRARAEALGDVATMGMSGRGGRQQLARSIVAGPGMYTRGQSLLDATLLGQSAAAQRAIEEGSRQALGAQQEIGKTALSAQEQAKAAESAFGKQKADIGTKLAEKLTGVEEAGGKEAQQFADDFNRFKQLMTATKSLDAKGNVVYKDANKNIINVTDKDRELISNPERFGLGAEIQIDPRVAESVLGDIATKGAFSYQKGMKKYTPEQEAIAKNLALLKGEIPSEYKPFETDIFKTTGENVAEKSEAYRGMLSDWEKGKQATTKSGQYKNLLDQYKYLMATQPEKVKRYNRGDIEYESTADRENRIFVDAGRAAGLSDEEINKLANTYGTKHQVLGFIGNEVGRLANEGRTYGRSAQTGSLQNYLRKMYGLQEEAQRDIPVEPRRPRQIQG